MLYARARPPLTVTDKPLTALFRHFRQRYDRPTEEGGHVIYVRFHRNKIGDTKTECYAGAIEAPCFGAVSWRARDKVFVMVSFDSEQYVRAANPVSPAESRWLPPEYASEIESTEDQALINGVVANRVVFRGSSLAVDEKPLRDECWVSYELGLVLLDIEQYPGRLSRWDTVSIEYGEPASSLEINIPEGFTNED
jgi:hypothetical protein